MDGAKEYTTQKSERQIPYDLTQVWNLRNVKKKNEQKGKRQAKKQTLNYRALTVTKGEGSVGMGKIGNGVGGMHLS